MEYLNPESVGTAVFILTTLVVGATELIKQAFNRNWKAVAIIAASAIIGGLGGAFLVPVVGLPAGLVVGLSASGLITSVQKIGEGTSSLTTK